MQVTNLLSPTPASSGSRPAGIGDPAPKRSHFDAVYQADDRPRPASSDARDKPSEAVARNRDDGKKPANVRDDPAKAKEPGGAETGGPDETDGVAEAGETESADSGDTAQSVDADADADPDAIVPQEAALAVTETPRPKNGDAATRQEAGEKGPARAVAAGVAATAGPPPTASPAAPEAVTHAEPADAAEAAVKSPAPSVQTAAAAQAAPLQAEEVVVRRIRSDDTAEAADRPGPRIDARPQVADARPTPTGQTAFAALAASPTDNTLQDQSDPALADIGVAGTRSTADQVARAEATVRHDTPRPVMQQVAEAARALGDGPVELTLKPEELGRVRMTLHHGADGSMTMSVQADRPETLDLMRRNIGDLAREFQDMGFANLNFSFGRDSSPPQQTAETDRDRDTDRTVAAIPLATPSLANRPTATPTSGGLDLRL